jgi:hypothetical protein
VDGGYLPDEGQVRFGLLPVAETYAYLRVLEKDLLDIAAEG